MKLIQERKFILGQGYVLQKPEKVSEKEFERRIKYANQFEPSDQGLAIDKNSLEI